jgi:hypothetical protein
VVPIGSGWRSAVTLGLEPALPMIAEVLALNRFRLAGELVVASTRVMLNPARELTDPGTGLAGPDVPRLSMLPVGPVVRWLVTHQDGPALKDHLAALVEQELRDHVGPTDRAALVRFWEQALPEVPIAVTDPADPSRSDPVLEEVLQVAFGLRGRAMRPLWPGGLSGLLHHPEDPPPDDTDLPSELLPNPHRDRRPDGPPPRWWRWWMAR